jgi:hypothetical protein
MKLLRENMRRFGTKNLNEDPEKAELVTDDSNSFII